MRGMANTPPIRLPVYVRVGDLPERQVGSILIPDGEESNQQALVGLFRAIADEFEKRL